MFRAVSLLLLLMVAVWAFAAETTAVASKTFGKAPTIKEATPISKVNAEPDKLAKQSLLISGRIIDMCKHKGCWLELMADDSSKIICKSVDESILFSKDCLGQTAQVQGTLIYDVKAPGTVTEKGEGGATHACPAPKVILSIEGANVAMAAVTPAATEKKDAKETPEPKK